MDRYIENWGSQEFSVHLKSVLDKYQLGQSPSFQVLVMDMFVNATDLSQQQTFKAVTLERFLLLLL